MKKLALLLGSLLLVGATAQAKEVIAAPVEVSKEVMVVAEPVVEEVVVVEAAAPNFRVTRFGQWIEVDNSSGSDDGDIGLFYFAQDLGLAYGDDWTFGVQAYKNWQVDTSEGLSNTGGRVQLDAWRKFNQDQEFKYALGTRVRFYSGNADFDRYYLRGNYSYGMFSGWADTFYNSYNGAEDSRDGYAFETMPLNMKFGPLTLGYFFGYSSKVGSNDRVIADGTAFDSRPEGTTHQLRAYFPLFNYGKLSTGAQFRLGLHKDNKSGEVNTGTDTVYEFGKYQRYAVDATYAYSQDLDFTAYYVYEITDVKDQSENDYYGEFGMGWNYKF
ncbi:hypothetical protein [uncultured Cetobacterium sp.]|uniref:hypothetical protein n=1 Tax=uncultured Cetobacterium sp. TaxID=527638 RepID=UPI00261ABD4A|nr:hypothetical protein [uncultured Cetobacterium sp.]